MIGALGTTLFFACNAIFANRSAQRLGSNPANLARLLVATAILAGWAHTWGRGLGGPSFGWFFVSGLAGFGLGGVAMFQALPRIGSPLAMLIVQCGSALVAVTVEWLWLGTRLTSHQLAWVTVTLAGVAVGLWSMHRAAAGGTKPGSATPAPVHSAVAGVAGQQILLQGVLWATVSACGQGAGAVLSRRAFQAAAAASFPVDPGTSAYQRALAGLLVAALVVLATSRWHAVPTRERAGGGRAWPWVIANAAAGPVLGVTCFQWALRTTPAGIVQPIVATAPLLTIPLAMWLERARPRPLYYVGTALAVTGVAGLFVFR